MTVSKTAILHNFDFVKSLGATYAFEHNSPTVVTDILKVLKKGDLVFDCISSATTQATCVEIVHKLGGGKLACLLLPQASAYEDVEVVISNYPVPAL